jgi:hypothetical protein
MEVDRVEADQTATANKGKGAAPVTHLQGAVIS